MLGVKPSAQVCGKRFKTFVADLGHEYRHRSVINVFKTFVAEVGHEHQYRSLANVCHDLGHEHHHVFKTFDVNLC